MKLRHSGLLVVISALLLLAVLAGPRVHLHPLVLPAKTWALPTLPQALQAWVDDRERKVHGLRPDNQARIVWANRKHPARAACAIVYLHGFSASQGEGAPVHRQLAHAFGCNLYLSRLPGHGLAAAGAMRGLTAQKLLQGAAKALAIGHALGNKVIVIGTSMGGTLALSLAARQPQPIAALLLWSPLVRERGNKLTPMLWPWGTMWLRYIHNHGSDIVHEERDSIYWAADVHLDGYRSLVELTREDMKPASFARITAPVFLGYYYRDAQHQDPTASVAAMLGMYKQLGTPDRLKRKHDFPDAGAHVIASPLRSHSSAAVFAASRDFLQQVVGLKPACADAAHSPSPHDYGVNS